MFFIKLNYFFILLLQCYNCETDLTMLLPIAEDVREVITSSERPFHMLIQHNCLTSGLKHILKTKVELFHENNPIRFEY